MFVNKRKDNKSLDDKFLNKPDYRKNMSKRSNRRINPIIDTKEVITDIPDNLHDELFLNKNIFS